MARLADGVAAVAAVALALGLGALPARAEPPHVAFHGHGAERGPVMRENGPSMRGGMRFAAAPPRFHEDGHFQPPRDEGRFAGGGRREGDRDGPRGDAHWGGGARDGWHGAGGRRYAVPPHWSGMHPDWDDGRRPGYWVRPWGPRWEPRYWGGGYWGGHFWPHVYLGWDFPWFLGALPVGYVTYWWGGVPYYYWQGVYYVWSPDYASYVVTDPPPLTGGAAEGAAAPPAQQPPGDGRGALSLYVYPKNGQSEQQTQSDRYQCHEWAVGQTGFDPTNPASDTNATTATPSNYKRAVTACLEARGYSVR
jgi:hypothetical protein